VFDSFVCLIITHYKKKKQEVVDKWRVMLMAAIGVVVANF